jgi:hypothetical protein
LGITSTPTGLEKFPIKSANDFVQTAAIRYRRITMTPRFLFRVLLLAVALPMTLIACDNSPKTYDACMLKASREAKNDRQFRTMAETCRDRFPDR